ncbi:unnamed protein product [Protopolystoma xenopodis]|uniref:Cadherin domain-containing protein n=1 Tax=Protopolystoma xenopodis TaxID=117903 RepID=A0A448WNG2_9PLAT|nr:unnamed protein product [Protopolystoma xenopodis]
MPAMRRRRGAPVRLASKGFWLPASRLLLLVSWLVLGPCGAVASKAPLSLQYKILEEVPVHTRIGEIREDLCKQLQLTGQPHDRLVRLFGEEPCYPGFLGLGRRDSESGDEVRFLLGRPSAHFRLDEVTGGLTVRGPIDLETLCPYETRQAAGPTGPSGPGRGGTDCGILRFSVNIQRQHLLLEIVRVDVVVADIDDCRPEFQLDFADDATNVYELRVAEAPATETSWTEELPAAVDCDVTPEFAQIDYRLLPDTTAVVDVDFAVTDDIGFGVGVGVAVHEDGAGARFRLSVGNDSRPQLHILTGLDYEKRREYAFVLVAFSRHRETEEARLPVRLYVLDVNDNKPVFEQKTYTVEVREDTAVGTLIVRVSWACLEEAKVDTLFGPKGSQETLPRPIIPEGKINCALYLLHTKHTIEN